MKTLLFSAAFLMLTMFVAGANLVTPFNSIQASAQYDDTDQEPEPTPEPDPGM